jgi:8-oxo-dGTP diphosphatase
MKIKDTEVKIVRGVIKKAKAESIVSANERLDEIKMRQAVGNALKEAEKARVKSLVFTVRGSTHARSPLKAYAKIMAQEILRHLRDGKSGLKEIIINLADKKAVEVFNKNLTGYLDYVLHRLKSPFVTVDAIIEINNGIVVIQRSNPPFGWALPGGFVDYGESLEDAAAREAKEETGLTLTRLTQFHTYSDPKRDPRFHTVGTVFIAKAKGRLKAGDDAAGAKIVKLADIEKMDFAFDHKQIILDYIAFRGQTPESGVRPR